MSTDPAEERLRRLLAEARHTDPVPDDVATRLDRVLADLEAERSAPAADLAGHRRRKAATLLVAAAAVVVAGVGVGQVLSGGAGSDADSGGDDADVPAAASAERESGGSDAGGADVDLLQDSSGSLAALVTAPPFDPAAVIRPDHFTDDVAILADPARATHSSGPAQSAPEEDAQVLDQACEPGPYGPGRLLGVMYGDAPAVLALRAPSGDSQVAELLECGTASVLRTTTLPAP